MTAPLDLTAWRIWAFRAVYTQANAAGGAIVVDFTAGAGNTMILMHAKGINSGTNGLLIVRVDEDNNDSITLANVVSAAAATGTTPTSRAQTTTTASGTTIDVTDWLTRLFAGGQEKLTVRQDGAGIANDTLTVDVRFLVRHGVGARDKSRSTNAADVTETVPTINRIL